MVLPMCGKKVNTSCVNKATVLPMCKQNALTSSESQRNETCITKMMRAIKSQLKREEARRNMWKRYIEHITDRKIAYEKSMDALQRTSKQVNQSPAIEILKTEIAPLF
jgi:siroheme synthase (precorrin-2 oxidase/ferrochelatase)